MDVVRESFCTFCFNLVKYNSEQIHDIAKEICDVFVIQFNKDISKDAAICERCIEKAKRCLHFKYTCINTEQIILAFAIATEKVNFHIREIYEENEHCENAGGYNNINLCRFCITPLDQSCMFFNALVDKNMAILTTILPEVDLKIVNDPIICSICEQDLEFYLNFMKTINGLKGKTEYRDEKCSILRKSSDFNYIFDKTYIEKQAVVIKNESDIKKEEFDWNEVPCKDMPNDNEKFALENIKPGFDTQITSDKDYSILTDERPYQCKNCGYKTKYKFVLARHMVVHKNFSEAEMFKCSLCPFKTKYKYGLTKHSLIHNHTLEHEKYKCKVCEFTSKYKKSLMQHMRVHKDVTGRIFVCPRCPYKATRKRDLTKHSLLHKSGSETARNEAEKFKNCSFCSYRSRRSHDLKRHMFTHKDISEIQMFKCPFCPVETKRSHDLKKHLMIIHKSNVVVKDISCSLCDFRTDSKDSFIRHLSVHKEGSELRPKKPKMTKKTLPVEIFYCSLCEYNTKRKCDLTSHVTLHEESSGVKVYTCPLCPFITKYRQNLKHHKSVHEGVSALETFYCKSCSYKTLRKSNLRKHMLVHKNASEVVLFPCASCSFKTRHKRSLVRHMACHNENAEVGK